jgi:hypothetical protein
MCLREQPSSNEFRSKSDRGPRRVPLPRLTAVASDRDGKLELAGSAILPQQERGKWRDLIAALAVAKTSAQGLEEGFCSVATELRVRVRHLKAKGVLRHATMKQLITD